MTTVATTAERTNVADRLAIHAAERPNATAVVQDFGPMRKDGEGVLRRVTDGSNAMYGTASFAYLAREASQLAHGLVAMGVRPGHRIALLVKPSIEFVALVFALLRSGATMVLVDGGLGRKNIVRCLQSTNPDGFVAIPQGHALRVLMRKKFPSAKFNVTVGRRWFWGGETLESLRKLGEQESLSPSGGEARRGGAFPVTGKSTCAEAVPPPLTPLPRGEGDLLLPHTHADDPAAIVFTSGSTGPPKGVVYRHETFVTQCDEIQREYDLRPDAIDLACFPLFGLFNVACGVTTVLPEMDFSRPASCDPKKLFAAANQWKVTQSFASPAVWDRLSRYAEQSGEKIPTLKKVFSCGAPVPAKVIRRTLAMVHPDAELHTPYGATEALPVATIEAREILEETAAKTDEGAGVCVGRQFRSRAEGGGGKAEGFDWRVIQITDDPIETIDETEELPTGEIGELIVRGPQVSPAYLDQPEASAPGSNLHNALAKMLDGDTVWHRTGDVGYLDEQNRFWYCGRKSQRVVTSEGTLFTECIEAIVNNSVWLGKSALVGIGPSRNQKPVVVYELDYEDAPIENFVDCEDENGDPCSVVDYERQEIKAHAHKHSKCDCINHFLPHPKLPTDIRHNSKIRREELAVWAAKQLGQRK